MDFIQVAFPRGVVILMVNFVIFLLKVLLI
jgi:hypothetical protein